MDWLRPTPRRRHEKGIAEEGGAPFDGPVHANVHDRISAKPVLNPFVERLQNQLRQAFCHAFVRRKQRCGCRKPRPHTSMTLYHPSVVHCEPDGKPHPGATQNGDSQC